MRFKTGNRKYNKLKHELSSRETWDGFKILMPYDWGLRAFYVRLDDITTFRVYKVHHLFSSAGGAWLIDFYVSFRDLKKLKDYQKKHQWGDLGGSIGIDCPPDDGIKIMESLKKYGRCNLRKYFYR